MASDESRQRPIGISKPAHQGDGRDFAAFECKRDSDRFRRTMVVMTLDWGSGLIASALVSCFLIFELSVHDYLIVSPILGRTNEPEGASRPKAAIRFLPFAQVAHIWPKDGRNRTGLYPAP
jgi:hypothetical protein